MRKLAIGPGFVYYQLWLGIVSLIFGFIKFEIPQGAEVLIVVMKMSIIEKVEIGKSALN
jgi:hypothetical protein